MRNKTEKKLLIIGFVPFFGDLEEFHQLGEIATVRQNREN